MMKIRKLFCSAIAALAAGVAFGATSPSCDDGGVAARPAGAKSVWPQGLADEMNTLVAFRTTFDAPAGADVRFDLAAWYSYRVTLNGEFVAFGPARGPKGMFRPDSLKLPAKPGRNVLQVEVAGYNCRNFYLMRQPPFFKGVVTAGGRPLAVSGRDFTAVRLPRVQKVPRYSYQRTFSEAYVLPGPKETPLALVAAPEPKLIARVAPLPAFEFNDRLSPVVFSHVFEDASFKVKADRALQMPGSDPEFDGFPMKDLTLNTAFLAQRLAYRDARPATAAEKAAAAFDLKGGESVRFDVGFNDTGFPGAKVTVRKPGRLVFTFDETLLRGEVHGCERYHFDCANIIVWDFTEPGEYAVDAFEPYTLRWLEVGVLSGEMTVSRPHFRSYKASSAAAASFKSSDPALGKIFDAAKETMMQNSVDVFMDCPSRERAGWNCDAYFTAPAATLLTGSTALERVFEENQALPASFEGLPDGVFPMCYPSDHRKDNFIPNWAMWFVLETEEYLARSGDRATIDALRPRIEKLVEFLWKYRNADGLLEKLPSWVFVEWSKANDFVQDVNYPSNMTWSQVLDAVARLYGRKDLAAEAGRVRAKIREQSWNGRFFRDHAVRGADGRLVVQDGDVTETCQYYAFFSGVATKELHPQLWRTVLDDFGPQRDDTKTHPEVARSAAFIGNYLRLKILEREGLGDRVLADCKGYFLKMAEETGTLWEHDDAQASCNHGFASYAAVLLARCVLGIEKVDLPAKRLVLAKEVRAKPAWAEGAFPVSAASFRVRRENGALRVADVPAGWTVETRESAAEGAVVWQIGKKDGSGDEFLYRYDAWEYGSTPQLPDDPHFNPATHVWRHVIPENRAYANANVPERIVPIYEAGFMPSRELVCGLELVWTEAEAGYRTLTVDALYSNWQGIRDDGIEMVAGDRKKVWALPGTRGVEKPQMAFAMTFPVKPGENRVLIRDVSNAKHYKVKFDALTLTKAERDDPPPPFLVPRVAAFSGIVHPGDPATLAVTAWNCREGAFDWSVADIDGKTVAKGAATLKDGRAEVALPTAVRGWFEVTCAGVGPKPATTTYAVTEPVEVKNMPASRFGCHASESDGYRLLPDDEVRDRMLSEKVRRASLGGARWVRLHSLSWALREPEKGKYLLDDVDRRFARIEKYKMNILLGVGQTPAWTSTSTNTKLTVCGNYGYLYYPPKDWQAWADYMKEIVRRFGSRVSHYEIGNEPGYSSAFWTCGDAPAFGKYLKTAYDAIKSLQPNAVVYPGAPLNVDFLDEAVRAVGGKPPFDVLSAHYLGNYRRNSEKPVQWRGLLRKYGLPEKFVNSEDMHWCSIGRKDGAVAGAESLVKTHVREAAEGVIRTFTFEGFGDYSDNYSFFTVRDEPKPYFAAYRAMTHRLEGADYVGSLSGADYEAYVFDRSGTPVTVVWRDEPGTVRLDFAAPRLVRVDLMDVESPLVSANGVHDLAVGPRPVYVEGGDLAFLKAQIDARRSIPESVQLRPGETRVLRWRDGSLTLTAPTNAVDGLYDRVFSATVDGRRIAFPVVMEVVTPGRGANRVRNGDFEQGTAFWFTPTNGSFAVIDGAGYLGSRGAKVSGVAHFGLASRIKVRPGEKYLISCRARGRGILGACLTKADAQGRSLNGGPGINALQSRVTDEWKRHSEIVTCDDPAIAYLSLAFLPNYGDDERKNTIYLDDVVVARLTERVSETKALNEGGFAATLEKALAMAVVERDQVVLDTATAPWKGPADLSATCRVALDAAALTLAFDVTDDVFVPAPADDHFKSYTADSIQFAIDPFDDGRDFTSFMLGRDGKGRDFLYKSANYVTAELPENITRNGDIASAQITRTARPGGYSVVVRIPLNEVYPLKGDAVQFGFSWLVNDNDGAGRKYMEWAGGIGSGSSATKFGTLGRK